MAYFLFKSYEKGKEQLVKYLIIIVTFRNAVVILDFEGVRLSENRIDPLKVVCV